MASRFVSENVPSHACGRTCGRDICRPRVISSFCLYRMRIASIPCVSSCLNDTASVCRADGDADKRGRGGCSIASLRIKVVGQLDVARRI
jgi:hypothetical protein